MEWIKYSLVYAADSIRKLNSKSNRTADSIRDSIRTQKNDSQVPNYRRMLLCDWSQLLPQDASELLPIYNKTSLSKYLQSKQVGDWSDSGHGLGWKSSTNGCYSHVRRI